MARKTVTSPGEACVFCSHGPITVREEEVSFRQWTDKGYAHCRVVVPVARCAHCGAGTIDESGDTIMDAAVRQAYDRLR
jgi:hypothetical protein